MSDHPPTKTDAPQGEGDLSIGLDVDLQGNVRLEFGKPVAWIGMPPREAAGLGRLLIKMAGVALRAQAQGKL